MYQCLVQQALSIIVSTGRDTFMVFMDKAKDVEPVKSHHPQDYSVEECECNQENRLEQKTRQSRDGDGNMTVMTKLLIKQFYNDDDEINNAR